MRRRYSTSVTVSRASLRSGPRPGYVGGVLAASVSATLLMAFGAAGSAAAAAAPIDLATAGTYSVLGGQTVTNTGPSQLSNDLGVSPGTAITGFPPGNAAGTTHSADAVALQAQADLTTAYNDAAGRAQTASVAGDLVGRTLAAGVYKSTGPLALSGTLTLDGEGDPNSVFIFQVASTLITASASYVNMINGAQACRVFWQVGSSATLGTASVFRGSILALTSVTVTTDTVVQGRALARNGAVTLDNNTFTSSACGTTVAATPSSTTLSMDSETATAGDTVTATATVTGAGTPTGTVIVSSDGTPIGSVPVDSSGNADLTFPVGSRAGTRTITATYTGSPTSLPSTSESTSLIVRAAPTTTAPAVPKTTAPASPSTTPPTTTTTRVTASQPPLARTGASRLGVLTATALALLTLGVMTTWTARRRHNALHRR